MSKIDEALEALNEIESETTVGFVDGRRSIYQPEIDRIRATLEQQRELIEALNDSTDFLRARLGIAIADEEFLLADQVEINSKLLATAPEDKP